MFPQYNYGKFLVQRKYWLMRSPFIISYVNRKITVQQLKKIENLKLLIQLMELI